MARADDIPDLSTPVRKWKSLSRSQRSSEIVSFARTKSQSAWSSVKVKMMKQAWPSDVAPSRVVVRPQEARWPNDAEESLFCESLLGVMQRCGRFDYLSLPVDGEVQKKEEEKEKEKEEEKEGEEPEREKEVKADKERRRSFLKQLRANRMSSKTI